MGYNLAAQEGMAMLMLQCRIIIGNCYRNQQERENMEREYQIASCLARDLHQTEILKVMDHNRHLHGGWCLEAIRKRTTIFQK